MQSALRLPNLRELLSSLEMLQNDVLITCLFFFVFFPSVLTFQAAPHRVKMSRKNV